MTTYTMNDLAHPQILQTATVLAKKQVQLGYCRYQELEDFVQDLMLMLTQKFKDFTGELPLVDWACKLLNSYLNAINRKFLGVPRYVPKANPRQTTLSVVPDNPVATPNQPNDTPTASEQHQPAQNQTPTVAASPISQPNPNTSSATGQSQNKTASSARSERTQAAQDTGRSGDPTQKPAGTVRKLLHGVWTKFSSWVQGQQRDRTPERTDSHPKTRRDALPPDKSRDGS